MHLSKLRKGWHLFLLCLPLASVSQDIQWEKSYGGKHADYLFDAVPTADYGFILAGSSLSGKTGNKKSQGNGNLDYWIWKMDESGESVWERSFGGSEADMLHSLKLTSDGGFILAGTSFSSKSFDKKEDSFGLSDFWIIKLDAGGGEQWQKTFGGVGAEELSTILQTSDGGFVLGGTSSSGANGNKVEKERGATDYWIIKLDRDGNIQWQKTYGGTLDDRLKSICFSKNGYLVLGYSTSPISGDKTSKKFGKGDYWVLDLDLAGNIVWQNTYGGEQEDQPTCLLKLKDGFLLGGYSNSSASGNKSESNRQGTDFWIVNIDNEGSIRRQDTYNYGKYDQLTTLVESTDGTILAGGHAKTESRGKSKEEESINDFIALKVSLSGEILWERYIGSDGDDVLIKLIEARDGGYIMAGTSNPAANNYGLARKSKDKIVVDRDKASVKSEIVQREIDDTMQSVRDSVNDSYKQQATDISEAIDTNLNSTEQPLKLGLNEHQDLLTPGKSGNLGSGISDQIAGDASNYKRQPASRSKSVNYGVSDFWVVKLKDKTKKPKAKQPIEAFPNPTNNFTNVVIGYEYEKGTASVYDISGRQLQQFAIYDRTIPISLSGLPQGVYIVEVKTNKSTNSIKIIKADN